MCQTGGPYLPGAPNALVPEKAPGCVDVRALNSSLCKLVEENFRQAFHDVDDLLLLREPIHCNFLQLPAKEPLVCT